MTARLLLILGALACVDPPDPQDAARPTEAHRLLQRGTLFLQQDRPARALAELAQAVALDSSSSTAHFQQGLAHARLDQPALAIAAFKRALALTPDQPRAHFALAAVLRDQPPLPRGSYPSGAGYRPSARARQISLLSRRGAPCHRRFCGRARRLQTHHRTRARPS